jgi:hypothetical protein
MLFVSRFLTLSPDDSDEDFFLIDLVTFIAGGMFGALVTGRRSFPGDAILSRGIDARPLSDEDWRNHDQTTTRRPADGASICLYGAS